MIALLAPLAWELSAAGGITVTDLRLEAQRRGLLPPAGTGRELSTSGCLVREDPTSGFGAGAA